MSASHNTSASHKDTPDTYCIRQGYEHRPVPEYFVDIDADTGIICQPDVYRDAALLAHQLEATTIIDVGCGNGFKLNELSKRFQIIGVDLDGPNLETCQTRYPHATWLAHDLDTDDPLPLTDDQLAGAIIINADVIEHLVRPEKLVKKLADALTRGAAAVLMSTPERELTWGSTHNGPPPNVCHTREWTIYELSAFLEREGLEFGSLGLTRNNNFHNQMNTILAVLVADEATAERVFGAEQDADQDLAA